VTKTPPESPAETRRRRSAGGSPWSAAGRGSAVAWWLAAVGAVLGVAAGVVQLVAGDVMPEWTGDKNDWVLLGLATIGLSLVAAVCFWYLRRPGLPLWGRVALVVVYVAAVIVCFTTVGRLWYLPGPMLLLALVLELRLDVR
jgi:hypothetical protein